MEMAVIAAAAVAFNATVVGVVEVSPGICQVDLLNPPELHGKVDPINTIKVDCGYVAQRTEWEGSPYSSPYTP